MICASVVFPTPGGPQRIKEEMRPASIILRKTAPTHQVFYLYNRPMSSDANVLLKVVPYLSSLFRITKYSIFL